MHRVRFYDPKRSQSRGRNSPLPSPHTASKGSKVTNLTPDWGEQPSHHPLPRKPPNVQRVGDKRHSSEKPSKKVPSNVINANRDTAALVTDNVESPDLLSVIDPRLLDGNTMSEQPGSTQPSGISSNPESRLEFCESTNYHSHTDDITVPSGISRNKTVRMDQREERKARRESPQTSGTFAEPSHATIEGKKSGDWATHDREDPDRPAAEAYHCGRASSIRKDLSEPDHLGTPSFEDRCLDNVRPAQLSSKTLPEEPISRVLDVGSPTSWEDNDDLADSDCQTELSGMEEGPELTRPPRRRHLFKAGQRDNLRHVTPLPATKSQYVPVGRDNRWKPYPRSRLSMLRTPTSPDETPLSEDLPCKALHDYDTDFAWTPEYLKYSDIVTDRDSRRIPIRGYLELSPGRLGSSVVLRGFLPPSEPSMRDECEGMSMLKPSSYRNERIRACSVDMDHYRMGSRFTAEEDELIHMLRNQGLSWKQMERYFPGRKATALQSRWSRQLQHGHRARNTKSEATHQEDYSGR